MGGKVCARCKKTLLGEFNYCTSCGAKIKSTSERNSLIVIVVVIIVFSVSPLIIKYGVNKPKQLTKFETEEYVERLKRKEILKKIDTLNNKAYVSLIVWSLFANNQKKEISRNLASYCAYKKGQKHNFISILDIKTKRVLLTYDLKGKYKFFR